MLSRHCYEGKGQYISSSESGESIVFQTLKKRLLQVKDEIEKTFDDPCVEDITKEVLESKDDAVTLTRKCGIDV